jgi:hypothetical protein
VFKKTRLSACAKKAVLLVKSRCLLLPSRRCTAARVRLASMEALAVVDEAHAPPAAAAPAAPARGARGAPRSARIALRPARASRPVVVPDSYDDGDEDEDDDGMETGKVCVRARGARAAPARVAHEQPRRRQKHAWCLCFQWAGWLLPPRALVCSDAARARALGRHSASPRRCGAGRALAAAARPSPARFI